MEIKLYMKRFSLVLFALAVTVWFAGCQGGGNSNNATVAEFGSQKVTLSEFSDAFSKNTGSSKSSDSLDPQKNFLGLYVNYRMKLADAYEKGYDKDEALMNELLDYKKKIGITYILEKNLVEPNVKRLWELRKFEYRVSHIMLRPDSTGEAGAKTKAQAVLDSILKFNKPFEEMAKKYSQDNFSAKNGGDVYYFTPLMIRAPEFEEAFVNTPVGSVNPQVVKTQFGYHIIKVTEKRERIPQIRCSHIMFSMQDDSGKVDSVNARLRADSVYQKVLAGEDFAELAKKYSQDHSNKENGGDLNFFERRMMVQEFDEAAFGLKINEVSKIVKTTYGFHIIKQTDRKKYPSFEDDKENLKTNYKLFRYTGDYDTLTANIRNKYVYKINATNLGLFLKAGDSVKIGPDLLKAPWYEALKVVPLFTIGNRSVSIDSFVTYAMNTAEFNGRVIEPKMMESGLKKFSDEVVVEYAALQLDKENPDFKNLMEDYKSGIFIFKLQEDEVWNKIQLDSARLVQHYENTKTKYVWPDRVEYGEIYTSSDSLSKVYYDMLKKGEDFDSVAAKYTERPNYKEKAGRFELADVNITTLSAEANKLQNSGDISKPFAYGGGYSIFKLYKKDASRGKTFEEAKAEVSGSFQELEAKRLEEAYINSLKVKYQPKMHYDALSKEAQK